MGENVDFEKNAAGRNQNKDMLLAIASTISSLTTGTDPTGEAIGWQGADIKSNENWQNWLFVKPEHRTNDFKAWMNKHVQSESTFETTRNYKGKYGTTIFFKYTERTMQASPTGQL